MRRIFLTRPMPDAVMRAGRAGFDVHERASNAPMSHDEMCAALCEYDAIMPTLGDRFDAHVFSQTGRPRAQILANFGVGYNHIDVAAAQAAHVQVSNTPDTVTDATADIAMTLILMSARRAGEGERMLRAGRWQGWHPTQMLGLHVTGKRVGIVGMGRIGQAIAARCRYGFGMQVSFFNRSVKAIEGAEQINTLHALAAQVDILVIAVPGGAQSHHLIDSQIFDIMPVHAHLINIARGDVVDEAALIQALERGKIAGAGLDVYEFEPAVPPELTCLDNVTLLPHLGTAAQEVRSAMGMMALRNIEAALNGGVPPNLVMP